MNKNKSITRQAREGFTLIEILLVVVIIGILAAVAVPKFSGRIGQSKVSACKSSLTSISLALDMYEVDHGSYPSSLNELISGSGPEWHGPYLKRGIPKDPWGNAFIYSAQQNNFTLKSSGDPKNGGEISLDAEAPTSSIGHGREHRRMQG